MIHMVIFHIKPQEVSFLYSKKSAILGGSETRWSSHKLVKPVIKDGVIISVDILASAMKEALGDVSVSSDKEVVVVLDHSLYKLVRTEIPQDMDKSEYHSYLKNAYIETTKETEGNCVFEMIVKEFESRKFGFVYTFDLESLETLEKSMSLLDMKVSYVVPEHISYYAIFEKTLRLDKHEYILFAKYESGTLEGYLFDTFGPVPNQKTWKKDKVSASNIESILKDKSSEIEKEVAKLNRIIIAGTDSEKIRQDTFTKNVGVWTNPLKRILPNFYEEYLNLLKPKSDSAPIFPTLTYPALFGGFVTAQDGKSFPFQKKKKDSIEKVNIQDAQVNHSNTNNMGTQSEKKGLKIPKEAILFLVIFIVTFALFYFIAASRSKDGVNLPFLTKPTETPTPSPSPVPPTPTPTVVVKREEVNVKVLNGTGVAGQAGGLKAALLKAGYVGVVTDNADKYDYTQSVLQIKSGKEYLESTILEDIKDFITGPKVETLDSAETADVVVIIGKDIK